MRHQNTVFHDLTKRIPWAEFDRIVERHRGDRRVRRLTCKGQLLALLFGQLSGADSLRGIATTMGSHSARLYHVGSKVPARSTLADANATRPWQVFGDLFAHMAGNANRATRRHIRDAVRILDATRIGLNGLSAGWAGGVPGTEAAKVHVVYDPVADVPLRADLTSCRVNDITPARALEPEAGATYVFDLGYYSFQWWADLDAAGCRFVTRLKRNTGLTVTDERPVEAGQAVLSDRTGYLPERMARSRRNPFSKPVRELEVSISTGKIIRVVTNDLEAPAEEIADLYKARWQIELLFKWIKQNLRIRRFLGTSENAVRIQIFAAMIAYLLLREARQDQDAVATQLDFTRLVRLNLMHRRSSADLMNQPTPPPPPDRRQLRLELRAC